jgi:hypothetical protein
LEWVRPNRTAHRVGSPITPNARSCHSARFCAAIVLGDFRAGYATQSANAWVNGGSPAKCAGNTWGFGRAWADLRMVRANRWMP